jgi:hypothetical protein
MLLQENAETLLKAAAAVEYKRDALQRLVRLYEAWDALAPNTGKAAQATEWRRKLEALSQAASQEPSSDKAGPDEK